VERFIDSFSRRLATAVSRRDMLRIASGTVIGALASVSGISRVWAASASGRPGGINSSQCGAVQQAAQLAIGNYNSTTYKNKLAYDTAVAEFLIPAFDTRLIDLGCSVCIGGQFVEGIPVASQRPCGSITMPSVTCDAAQPSQEQISAVAGLALQAVPNGLGEGAQYAQLIQLSGAILGCTLATASGAATSASPAASGAAAAALATPSDTASAADTCVYTCAVAGCNYCGPGNSCDPAYAPNNGWDLTVACCLNDACCMHDNCYSQGCIGANSPCAFTAGQSACDSPLIAICQGTNPECSISITDIESQIVCAWVLCATVDTSSACENYRLYKNLTDPQCNTPCVDSACCPAGTTCMTAPTVVRGAITGVCCPPGSTACELTCCSAGQICSNGSCVAAPCASGLPLCGTICCQSGQTCSNGQCVATTCPPGPGPATPCGAGGGCCYNGEVCCGNAVGQFGCGYPNGLCCGTVGSCPSGTTCCIGPTGNTLSCCSAGETCCPSGGCSPGTC
jgi:hypothetical protein